MRRLLVLAALTLAACGADGTEVRVTAASSLTDAFTEIGAAFEAASPGTVVTMSFAGSATVREQVLEGSPADVVALADFPMMERLSDAGALGRAPVPFATNTIVIGVPSGNPSQVTGLSDVGDESLLIGLCVETVPCGELAASALAAAGIEPAPDTLEPNVRLVMMKIASGDLDAGIVYTTDALAAVDDIEAIGIQDAPVTVYPIAAVAADNDDADAFVAFVLGPDGQAILAAHGFGPIP